MKAYFDIDALVESGLIRSELEYERALIADRKLRILAKDNSKLKKLRMELRALIESYEKEEWSDVDTLTDEKLRESDEAERIAEVERAFFEERKQLIRKKLKELDLTQENLGFVLGHKSKTHMSELMNGIKPFTLKDLIIINRVLQIDISVLIPRFLSKEDQAKVNKAVEVLNKPKIKLVTDELLFS